MGSLVSGKLASKLKATATKNVSVSTAQPSVATSIAAKTGGGIGTAIASSAPALRKQDAATVTASEKKTAKQAKRIARRAREQKKLTKIQQAAIKKDPVKALPAANIRLKSLNRETEKLSGISLPDIKISENVTGVKLTPKGVKVAPTTLSRIATGQQKPLQKVVYAGARRAQLPKLKRQNPQQAKQMANRYASQVVKRKPVKVKNRRQQEITRGQFVRPKPKIPQEIRELGPDAAKLARASIKYGKKYGIAPSVLFNQQGIESGWGADTVGVPLPHIGEGPAQGWTQFIPSTRQHMIDEFGVDPWASPKEGVKAQALYLRELGYADSPQDAVYGYNHSTEYVNQVLDGASQYSVLDKAAKRSTTRQQGPSFSSPDWTPREGITNVLKKTGGKEKPDRVDVAQGAIEWARRQIGTATGDSKQLNWLAKLGHPQEEWCGDFVAMMLTKKGGFDVEDLPEGFALADNWSSMAGATEIGDIAQAKPGDIIEIDTNSDGGTNHVGIYTGNGNYISGNTGPGIVDEKPISDSGSIVAIVRPPYEGTVRSGGSAQPAGPPPQVVNRWVERSPQSSAGGEPADFRNLDPKLQTNLVKLAKHLGTPITLTSGFRTYEQQQYLVENPQGYPVAPAGTSDHETGHSADVLVNGEPIQDAVDAATLQRFGLAPLAGDAVHVDLAGNATRGYSAPTGVTSSTGAGSTSVALPSGGTATFTPGSKMATVIGKNGKRRRVAKRKVMASLTPEQRRAVAMAKRPNQGPEDFSFTPSTVSYDEQIARQVVADLGL